MYCLVCAEQMRGVEVKEKSGLKGEGILHGCDSCNFLYLQKHGRRGVLTLVLNRVKLSEYETKDAEAEKERHKKNYVNVRCCPKCAGEIQRVENCILRFSFREARFLLCGKCDIIFVESSREFLSIRAQPQRAEALMKAAHEAASILEPILEEERERREEEERLRKEEEQKRLDEQERNDPDMRLNPNIR